MNPHIKGIIVTCHVGVRLISQVMVRGGLFCDMESVCGSQLDLAFY